MPGVLFSAFDLFQVIGTVYLQVESGHSPAGFLQLYSQPVQAVNLAGGFFQLQLQYMSPEGPVIRQVV